MPNSIIENVLCKYTFPAYELRLLFFIMRNTVGWNVPGFYTSYRKIVTATAIDLRNVGRTLKALEGKNIIATRKGKQTHIEFNPKYMTWRLDEPETLFTGVGKCNSVLSVETTEGVVCRDNTGDLSKVELSSITKGFWDRVRS